jgi:hypothetical protein
MYPPPHIDRRKLTFFLDFFFKKNDRAYAILLILPGNRFYQIISVYSDILPHEEEDTCISERLSTLTFFNVRRRIHA